MDGVDRESHCHGAFRAGTFGRAASVRASMKSKESIGGLDSMDRIGTMDCVGGKN
jgi:hypothetical protein